MYPCTDYITLLNIFLYTLATAVEIVYTRQYMTLAQILLAYLKSNKADYRELRKLLYGYSDSVSILKHKNLNDQTIRTTLYRLKKKGLVLNEKGTWDITHRGEKYIDDNQQPLKFFRREAIKSKSRKIICMFDIPEDIRYKRNWLRSQLELLDFTSLQQSVWIGPAPLPTEFISYLKEIELLIYIKFLEVTNDSLI